MPPGEIGEVFLRPLEGPGTSYRYIGAEAKAIDGGWESLGDMGWMDAEGYLYLTDRLSDMILSGGANIYPAEVERVLREIPGVADGVVVGRSDERWGEVPVAVVTPAPGAALSRAARGSMRDALSLADQAIAYGGGRVDEGGVRAMLGSVDGSHPAALVEQLARRDGASSARQVLLVAVVATSLLAPWMLFASWWTMLAPGNPLGIRSIEDAAARKARVATRPAGAASPSWARWGRRRLPC